MSLSNVTSAELMKLSSIGAEAQAIDLPNGYKLTRKQNKTKSKPTSFAWHLSKRGWHIDASGNIGDKWDVNSSVHHASLSDALNAYDNHLVVKSQPGYNDWLK